MQCVLFGENSWRKLYAFNRSPSRINWIFESLDYVDWGCPWNFFLQLKGGQCANSLRALDARKKTLGCVWCYRKITNSVSWCSGDNVITLLLIILYIFSIITFHSSLLICPVSELETPSENAKSISPPRNLHHRWLHTLFKIWLYEVSAIQVPV